MKATKCFVSAFVVLLLSMTGILAAQDVKYNFMPGTDFSKYRTYKWVNIQEGAHPNQIVDAQIKQSADSQLASKGWLYLMQWLHWALLLLSTITVFAAVAGSQGMFLVP